MSGLRRGMKVKEEKSRTTYSFRATTDTARNAPKKRHDPRSHVDKTHALHILSFLLRSVSHIFPFLEPMSPPIPHLTLYRPGFPTPLYIDVRTY